MQNFDLFAGPRKQICRAFRGLSDQVLRPCVVICVYVCTMHTHASSICCPGRRGHKAPASKLVGQVCPAGMFGVLRACFDMVNHDDENILEA